MKAKKTIRLIVNDLVQVRDGKKWNVACYPVWSKSRENQTVDVLLGFDALFSPVFKVFKAKDVRTAVGHYPVQA